MVFVHVPSEIAAHEVEGIGMLRDKNCSSLLAFSTSLPTSTITNILIHLYRSWTPVGDVKDTTINTLATEVPILYCLTFELLSYIWGFKFIIFLYYIYAIRYYIRFELNLVRGNLSNVTFQLYFFPASSFSDGYSANSCQIFSHFSLLSTCLCSLHS